MKPSAAAANASAPGHASHTRRPCNERAASTHIRCTMCTGDDGAAPAGCRGESPAGDPPTAEASGAEGETVAADKEKADCNEESLDGDSCGIEDAFNERNANTVSNTPGICRIELMNLYVINLRKYSM